MQKKTTDLQAQVAVLSKAKQEPLPQLLPSDLEVEKKRARWRHNKAKQRLLKELRKEAKTIPEEAKAIPKEQKKNEPPLQKESKPRGTEETNPTKPKETQPTRTVDDLFLKTKQGSDTYITLQFLVSLYKRTGVCLHISDSDSGQCRLCFMNYPENAAAVWNYNQDCDDSPFEYRCLSEAVVARLDMGYQRRLVKARANAVHS